MCAIHGARPRRTRTGLTLLEMIISLTVLTVMMGAAMYAVMLGGQTLRASAEPAATGPNHSDLTGRILAEIRTATSFSERTESAVTFTVADRDGNGTAESIRYSWSGVAGEPLYRRYNAETPVVVATDVRDFSFDFITERISPPPTEVPLIEHVDGPGGSTSTHTETFTNWWAQYFKPTLPAGATGWRVTRISLYCKRRSGTTPGNLLSLRLVHPGAQLKPGMVVHESLALNPMNLPSALEWVDFEFNDSTWLSPSQGMCMVMAQVVAGKSAEFRVESGGSAMTPNSHFMTSSSLGVLWSEPNQTQDVLFKVYGLIRTD